MDNTLNMRCVRLIVDRSVSVDKRMVLYDNEYVIRIIIVKRLRRQHISCCGLGFDEMT